jgi:hypothetical protein
MLFMALIAIVFAGLGTAIGSTLQKHAGLSVDHEFLVMRSSSCRARCFRSQHSPQRCRS